MDHHIRHFLNAEPWATAAMGTDRHINHYHMLTRVLECGVEGDVIECGTFRGGTAKLFGLVMQWQATTKKLHLYDSFEGLPELHKEDLPDGKTNEIFCKGSFKTPVSCVHDNMAGINVDYQIHKGWFRDTLPQQLPSKICYAHLDGDLYHSIQTCLACVYDRLAPGAICVIDDYGLRDLPGAKQATDEFMADKPETVWKMHLPRTMPDAIHAYFKKV